MPSRKVLCLDWDNRSLRMVAARITKGRTILEDAHSHRLPENVDAQDAEALGGFIQQMLRRHGLRHRSAMVDVPRERAVINRVTLPPTPDEEVAAAVRFQAMRELPFPVDSAALDYVITERNEKGLTTEVLLAAVTLETLERLKATCLAAGLTPSRIGLRPYANLVSAQHVKELDERHLLFVDVGPGATEIDVFWGKSLAFARSANVNVPVPTGDPRNPEDSRIISLADLADLDLDEGAIEAAVDELLVEVTRTLQAYRATEAESTIDGIIVAGGTGIESHLADALHERMGYPVDLFDPTAPLRVDPTEAPKLRSFSAALGLSWGLSKEGLLALDFLNPKRPVSAREVMQKRVRMIGMAAAIAVLAIGGGLRMWYMQKAGVRDELETRNKSLREELKEKMAIKHQVERAQEWGFEAIWPEELLTITETAVDPGKKMLVQNINLECGPRNQRITLGNVYVSDPQVPLQFVEKLKGIRADGNPLYDVRLGSLTEISEGQRFKGKLDITIEPLELQERADEIAAAEKERPRRKKR